MAKRKQSWFISFVIVDRPKGRDPFLTKKEVKDNVERGMDLDSGLKLKRLCIEKFEIPKPRKAKRGR